MYCCFHGSLFNVIVHCIVHCLLYCSLFIVHCIVYCFLYCLLFFHCTLYCEVPILCPLLQYCSYCSYCLDLGNSQMMTTCRTSCPRPQMKGICDFAPSRSVGQLEAPKMEHVEPDAGSTNFFFFSGRFHRHLRGTSKSVSRPRNLLRLARPEGCFDS